MSFILHRGGDRFVVQCAETGAMMGLMLQPIPGESIKTMRLWGDFLYGVTTNGSLACFDTHFTPEAIATEPAPLTEPEPLVEFKSALPLPAQKRKQKVKPSSTLSSPTLNSPTLNSTQTAPQTSDRGVLVECFKQGSKLKVRAISPEYHSDWNVQFPTNLRQEGLRYRVEALEEAKQGGFYRVVGWIKPLEDV